MAVMSGTPPSSQRNPVATAALAFIAGALAVIIFQQILIGLLYLLGVIPGGPFNMRPTAPLGVPQLLSSAFWGGLWGIAFAFAADRVPARAYWALALLFGAGLLPAVGWFVVQPLKGQPIASGWQPARMGLSVLINGIWGIGVAIAWRVLRRPSAPPAG
ncbi:MAG TPA: hypothetical protein VF342_08410 [Alphaproteobacteria bacterium]